MAKVKFTKTELRIQQLRLTQLKRYLPTLLLKKAMLQMEVNQAESEIDQLELEFKNVESRIQNFAPLFSGRGISELLSSVKVKEIRCQFENIAGIDVPIYEKTFFEGPSYFFFDSPVWLEPAIDKVGDLIVAREKRKIVEEKKRLLAKELRDVSIRVNLFEKILIPRAEENIKRIKIFLGDQQLTAVSQAKVSKKKIYLREAYRQ